MTEKSEAEYFKQISQKFSIWDFFFFNLDKLFIEFAQKEEIQKHLVILIWEMNAFLESSLTNTGLFYFNNNNKANRICLKNVLFI